MDFSDLHRLHRCQCTVFLLPLPAESPLLDYINQHVCISPDHDYFILWSGFEHYPTVMVRALGATAVSRLSLLKQPGIY